MVQGEWHCRWTNTSSSIRQTHGTAAAAAETAEDELTIEEAESEGGMITEGTSADRQYDDTQREGRIVGVNECA